MTEHLKAMALVIAGAVIGLLVSANGVGFGGVYNNVANDFSEGITVDGTTIIDGTGNITSPDGTFSDDVAVTDDISAANISIATTSATRHLNIGAGTSATTTINAGKPCFQYVINTGGTYTVVFYWPTIIGGGTSGWATSSTSCF